MSNLNGFDPADEGPFRARTTTLGYHFPPVRPVTVPAADLCTRAELQDIASGAAQHHDQMLALLNSEPHVRHICADYVDIELEHAREIIELQRALAAQQGINVALAEQLDQTRALMDAEMAERNRIAAAHGVLSAQNRWLHRELAAALSGQRIAASFERLTVTVTGESYAVVAERLTAAVSQCASGDADVDLDERFDATDIADWIETTGKIVPEAASGFEEQP